MRPNDEHGVVLANRRRSTFLGLLTSVVDPVGASSSSSGRRAEIGCGPSCEPLKKNCSDECMNLSHNRVSGWDKSYADTSRITLCRLTSKAWVPSATMLRTSGGRALQRRSQRDRSTWERIAQLAAEFLPPRPYPSSLAERTLRRQTPKVGARCVNHARRDLCGGRSAMGVPTAIGRNGPAGQFGDEDHVDLAGLRQRQDLLAFGALLLCPGGDFLPDPHDFVASLLGEGA